MEVSSNTLHMAEGTEAVSTRHPASMSSQQLFTRIVLEQPHNKSVLGTYNSCSKNAQDTLSAQRLHSSPSSAQQAVFISPIMSKPAFA